MQPNRSVASLGYADTVHIIISCIQSRTGILSRRWEPTASHKNIIDSCCSEVHNCWLYNIRHLIGYHWVIIIWYKWSMIIIVRPPSLIIFGGLMMTGGTGFLLCNRGHPKFEPWFNPGPGRIFYGCHRWSFPKGWTGKLSQNWYQHSNIAEFINGNNYSFFLSMENSVST